MYVRCLSDRRTLLTHLLCVLAAFHRSCHPPCNLPTKVTGLLCATLTLELQFDRLCFYVMLGCRPLTPERTAILLIWLLSLLTHSLWHHLMCGRFCSCLTTMVLYTLHLFSTLYMCLFYMLFLHLSCCSFTFAVTPFEGCCASVYCTLWMIF